MDKYTYEQAFNDSVKYFNGDELAAKAFLDKYALRNNKDEILENTPEKMHVRLASEFARIQKNKYKSPLSKDAIFNLLNRFEKIIPQGSPMFGIGNNFQVCSISNCFVLDIPEDSYNSILDVDKQLVNISKRRGGVGIDLSKLRPRGSATNNAARSSTGIISWMERYSNSIREVGQHGRRGALMLTLSVHHPDILDFATVKNDNSKVTGANISVRLSQEFLDAVKNDSEYELRFPVDYKETGQKPKVSKFVKAKEIWKTIIKSAWMRAEPGLVMWDNVLKGPADCYEKYRSVTSNPCSEIFMPSLESCRLLAINLFGYVKNPFTEKSYFDYDEFYKETKIAQRLMDDVVDLESEKIDQIIAKVKSDPESEEIKKDEINLWERIKKLNDECRRTGLGITAIGDTLAAIGVKYGSEESIAVTEKIYQTLKLAAYESSIEMAEELGSFKDYDAKKEENCEFIQLIKAERPDLYERMVKVGRRNIALTTTAPTGCSVGSSMVISDQGIIRFDEMIKETENGFYEIENLNVIQEKRNTSYKVSKKFVNGLANTKKIVLKSGIELESTLNHQYRVLENGEYLWRKVGDLKIGDMLINRIGGYDKFTEENLEIPNLDAFNNHNNKDINLPVSINEELSELLGIIYADGSVHEKGIRIHIDRNEKELIGRICQLVSNQFGLYPTVIQEKTCASIYINSLIILDYLKLNGMLKGFCETVSIPLKIRKSSKKSILSFIHGYWLGDGSESKGCRYIDTVSKQMAQDIAICLRAVGQNIHISKHENRENSFGNLPLYRVFLIGFGSENFEKYRYIQRNLKETFKIVKNIGETLFFDKIESLEDSKAFTYDIEVPENNCYVLNSFISHNTVSLMAQTSSGIEPVFSLGYKRRKKINPNDKNGRIDFVDQNGDSWQEFMVVHPKLKDWFKQTEFYLNNHDETETIESMHPEILAELIKGSPWYGATANEIDWINRVKLQAAAQKHVCHAISSTINLPETVTEEKVAEIYETAFASGVKGITIYRDNCRTGVLVSKEEKKKENKINHNNAPKRPQVLDADVHHLSYQNNRYYVVVGLLEKDPYEIFIGLNNDGEGDVVIPKSIKAGLLAKEGKGKYVLKTEDFSCVLKNTHTDENADVLARMLSSALRHGCSIEFLTHQLEKTKGGLTSFSKILSRAIKKYIKDGVVVSGEACPECGGKLVRESGCKICKGTEEKVGCGWTACN